jgi:hypothetical protein
MKQARWEECAESSITAQIRDLRQIEANLLELPVFSDDVLGAATIAVAVSFVRQARETLSPTRSDANPNG